MSCDFARCVRAFRIFFVWNVSSLFISVVFKDKYLDNVFVFIKRRIKSLLVLYFLYSAFYLVATLIIEKFTGKFWGMELSLKNFFITPFLNGHQLDLSCPMWFVPQLFIAMISFLFLQKMLRKNSEKVKFIFYLILGLSAIPLTKIIEMEEVSWQQN